MHEGNPCFKVCQMCGCFEHHIYAACSTGHDLAQNAADLIALTSNDSVLSILEDLDRHTDEIEHDETLCHGPFHAFKAKNVISPDQNETVFEIFDSELWDAELAGIENMLDDNILFQLVRSPDGPPLLDNSLDHHPQGMNIPNVSDSMCSGIDLQTPSSSVPFSPSRSPPPDLEDFSMPMAKQLLDHYRLRMVAFFTPARVESKSPWQSIYIPSLLSTVGEIELAGESSNAKVSLLFSIFAISCFSMDGCSFPTGESHSPDWKALGELYRERATRRLKHSLHNVSRSGGKKEKYKDVLMALLSMVTICVGFLRKMINFDL